METRPRAAIYIRCARQDQFATDEQRKRCREYIERKGYQLTKEYVDMGANGISDIRSAFDAMTIDAHVGEMDKIIVVSMSRISRSARNGIAFCNDLRESCGVVIESIKESDTTCHH